MASSARQAQTTLKAPASSARQAQTRLLLSGSARQAQTTLTARLSSARQSQSRLFGSEFAGFVRDQQAATWQAQGRQLPPHPYFRLQYAGHDLTELVGDLQISRPLNGKTQVDFDFRPPGEPLAQFQSDLVPPGYGTYAGKIRQHNGTKTRAFTLQVSVAGETWPCTTLLPLPASYTDRLSWGAEDCTALLEFERDPDLEEPQFLDIVKAQGDLITAHQAAAQAAAALGIAIECRYPDYLIGVLRRGQGTALSWLDALAKPMQAARRWVGDRLVYEQVNPLAPPAWRFVDRLNIQTLSLEELPRARNKFVLARFDSSGGFIGEAAEVGGGAIGRKRISFTASNTVAIDVLKVVNGVLKDWTFYNGSTVLNPSPYSTGFWSGSTPADSAEFTYQPQVLTTSWQPAFEVVARGLNAVRSGAYRFTGGDTALQSIYGIYPEGRPIEEPTLGDESGASLSLQAYVREAARRVWRASFETPYLNPFVEPGQVIEIVDYLTRQSATRWVVEQVVMLWRGRRWSMRIDCARGEQ
jgi:hypothetical protein